MATRETMGSQLKKARKNLGLSVPELAQKIKDEWEDIGESTIRDIEKDKTENPGIKTIERIALGVGLPPLEVIALWLYEPPPESTHGFSESYFAALWRAYSRVKPHNKRERIDDLVQMLVYQINKT
jgi:transcriptional regulator with XRE-family HTH domain